MYTCVQGSYKRNQKREKGEEEEKKKGGGEKESFMCARLSRMDRIPIRHIINNGAEKALFYQYLKSHLGYVSIKDVEAQNIVDNIIGNTRGDATRLLHDPIESILNFEYHIITSKFYHDCCISADIIPIIGHTAIDNLWDYIKCSSARKRLSNSDMIVIATPKYNDFSLPIIAISFFLFPVMYPVIAIMKDDWYINFIDQDTAQDIVNFFTLHKSTSNQWIGEYMNKSLAFSKKRKLDDEYLLEEENINKSFDPEYNMNNEFDMDLSTGSQANHMQIPMHGEPNVYQIPDNDTIYMPESYEARLLNHTYKTYSVRTHELGVYKKRKIIKD